MHICLHSDDDAVAWESKNRANFVFLNVGYKTRLLRV